MSGPHEVPDEWLVEAGVKDFKPDNSSFRCDDPHTLIAISDIQPHKRSPSVVLSANGFDHDRMMRILTGIKRGESLPAIFVQEADPGAWKYALREGFHRFYASVAFGFSQIPGEVIDRF